MFIASYQNTENGIRRNSAQAIADRQMRIRMEHTAIAAERTRLALEAAEREISLKRRINDLLNELHGTSIRYRHSYRTIERRTCDLFGVTSFELKSERRNRRVAFARQFLMYWAARLTPLSLVKIGEFMKRDHTTVLHGKQVYVAKRAAMGRTLRSVR